MSFQLQWNFAKNRTAQTDLHLTFHQIPGIGNLKIGRFQEPFTLEELTSNTNFTFMERALPNVFAPSYNTGVELYNTALEDRVSWQLALTWDTNSAGDSIRPGRAVTGRITGRPIHSEDGRRLLHLGAAYSLRSPNDTIRLRARPESNMAPFLLDTGEFYADDIRLLGLEVAGVYGPFAAQAEYMRSDITTRLAGSRQFDGWYAEASYFLTGEHRPYSTAFGTFGPVTPRRAFNLWDTGESRGLGAWQIAARYSELDLNDGPIRGGQMQNWTVGVNWYLNAITRISMNYVRADVNHDLYWGKFDTLQLRVQVRF